MGKIVLGKPLTVEEFVEVARFHAEVEFSEEYCERVKKSREIMKNVWKRIELFMVRPQGLVHS